MPLIDTTKPIYFENEEIQVCKGGFGILYLKLNGLVDESKNGKCWDPDGEPLGNWSPITNEPPCKSEQ